MSVRIAYQEAILKEEDLNRVELYAMKNGCDIVIMQLLRPFSFANACPSNPGRICIRCRTEEDRLIIAKAADNLGWHVNSNGEFLTSNPCVFQAISDIESIFSMAFRVENLSYFSKAR